MKAFLLKYSFICCSYLYFATFLTLFAISKLLENLTCFRKEIQENNEFIFIGGKHKTWLMIRLPFPTS